MSKETAKEKEPKPKRSLANGAVMPGFEHRPNRLKPEFELNELRWQKPLGYVRFVLEDAARRVDESRAWFSRRFYRGDCHAHSQHSDGIGTVPEMAAMAKTAGLDFQYITDHWGLTQTKECRRHRLWVGQEPVAHLHHLVVLGLKKVFVPGPDLAADCREVARRGGTPFIPHPTGWWPSRVYRAEALQSLESLPDPFLMEIVNGANNIVSAFDYTDAAAIALWDKLLTKGRRVHALGNTDAHSPHGIGTVWNGVFAPRCEESVVLRALAAGRCFVSEAPLLDLSVGPTGMGQRARRRGQLCIQAADARGLLLLRLVADGKTLRTWHPVGQPVVRKTLALPKTARTYVRLEAVSMDGKRGYTNPVYLQTATESRKT